jgi:UDP:flavonoid glycosyltransferase YjiC (YdhE family)
VRILFTTTPGRGHYHAMLPLARACCERGHEVLWATASDACAGLRERGFDAIEAGLPEGSTSGDLAAAFPEVMALPPSERPDHLFAKIFGPARAVPMLDELLPVVGQYKPALLVCDLAELAGPVAAAAAGVPNVTHAFGNPLPQVRIDRAARAMAPVWREHGLDPRPHAGLFEHLYVDIYPESLKTSAVPAGTAVQPIRPAPVVDRVPDDGSPLVYVTFGTVWSRDLSGHRTVLEGIRDLPIRVIVTVGPGADPAGLGEQPANVEIADYIPQGEILPRASAVVSHAGSGTFLAALATGLPQVVLPIAADQFLNAAAGAAAGAAIRIEPEAFDAATVREALTRVLDEPAYEAAAVQVRDEMRAMPAPEVVVAELERRFGLTGVAA